jgi:hypothetical protein
VAWYGWYELHVSTGADPIVQTGTTLQQWLAASLNRTGVIVAVAVVFAALLAVALYKKEGPPKANPPEQSRSV